LSLSAERGSLPRMPDDPRVYLLRNRLAVLLEAPVHLTVTDNRRSMITFRWHDGRLHVRLHNMFLLADVPFVKVLAAFFRRPTPANRATIARYIDEHSRLINHDAHPAVAAQHLHHKGQYFDLQELFDRVNARFFKRACDSHITWGKIAVSRRRRSIMLGSYDYEGNVIRLHPSLDASWVPRYVVETLIYHEILHWLFRPRHDGVRRVLHSPAFREAERAHPHYDKTSHWIENNIQKLLTPQR